MFRQTSGICRRGVGPKGGLGVAIGWSIGETKGQNAIAHRTCWPRHRKSTTRILVAPVWFHENSFGARLVPREFSWKECAINIGFFNCFFETTNFLQPRDFSWLHLVPREFSWKCLWFGEISRGSESGIPWASMVNFRSSLVLAVSSLRSPVVANPPFPQPPFC